VIVEGEKRVGWSQRTTEKSTVHFQIYLLWGESRTPWKGLLYIDLLASLKFSLVSPADCHFQWG
jgi:hypothetical protein